MSQRHIHLRLASSPNFSGSTFFDSDVSQAPQVSGASINLAGLSTIYAIIQLNFVVSLGGAASPFPIGTTPYLRSLGLTYGVLEL